MAVDIKIHVLFARFDYKQGPFPEESFPKGLSGEQQRAIASKVFHFITAEQELPRNLEILSFPKLRKKGVIKYFHLEETDKKRYGALILIFDEIHDVIFYKYIKEFRVDFEGVSVQLKEKGADLHEILGKFHKKSQNMLIDIKKQETTGMVNVRNSFPSKDIKSYTHKMIVCGDPRVGKTSIILRFTNNAFRTTYMATMGVNLSQTRVKLDNKEVDLVVWDIAGQTKFQRMRKYFYIGSKAFLLVFDLTDRVSFESVEQWKEDIDNHLKKSIPGVLIGNKADLDNKIEILDEEAMELAAKLGIEFVKTSALTGKNLQNVFLKIARFISN